MKIYPPTLSPLATRFKQQTGFTLIELMITVAIMVVLTSIGLVSYRQVSISARDSRRKADLESVRQSLVIYRTDNGTYPAEAGAALNSDCSGDPDQRDTYVTMINTLASDGYLTVQDGGLLDPKDGDGCYGYRYNSDGSTFTLCAKLESDETPDTHSDDYCANSP